MWCCFSIASLRCCCTSRHTHITTHVHVVVVHKHSHTHARAQKCNYSYDMSAKVVRHSRSLFCWVRVRALTATVGVWTVGSGTRLGGMCTAGRCERHLTSSLAAGNRLDGQVLYDTPRKYIRPPCCCCWIDSGNSSNVTSCFVFSDIFD